MINNSIPVRPTDSQKKKKKRNMVDLQMALGSVLFHFTSIFIFDGMEDISRSSRKLGFIYVEVTLGTIKDVCVWNLIFLS